ncbi:MAG TPA: tRNA pseudouridine(13) synthase TruD [Methanoregulaceae archaeon]|nr:tRNA pseudouridine(13) synthase TruD [Methanoregulaceae archaeon]
MKPSPYPLEQILGMRYYASDTPGIGGRLRAMAEDFVVEEIPSGIGTEGPFLICRLTKKDWDQQRAVREIAKRLGISYRRINFSGTKDKHAITSQLISLQGISPEEIERVQIRDISLEVVGRSSSPLALGSHAANRFVITIRETAARPAEVALVDEVCRTAIPNYFGIQRFGVIRPVTHTTGAFILKGDYEGAVCHYIAAAFPGETAEVREARTAFLGHRDPQRAIREFPLVLNYERSMLHHLATHPDDYRGALSVLPPKLLSMLVSAYQSSLFNRALSIRIDDGHGLLEPAPGDRLLFAQGREDRVLEQTVRNARLQIARGRCRIAIRMPGCGDQGLECNDTLTMAGLLAEDGIERDDFCRAADVVHARFDGASRPIALATAVDSLVSGEGVRLSFSLEPGQYATTVCREYMKADPLLMV